MKKAICLLLLLIFIFLPPSVYAVSLTLDSIPQTIDDETFTIFVTVTGAASGQNYLRIDLYKEGTTEYFGETYSGSEWYSGSDGKKYFPITVVSNIPSTATLQGRLGNPSSTSYPGPGEYKIRVRRYSDSGGSVATEQSPQTISITYSFPTATPTPTALPSDTPTPSPTKTPTPTKTLAPSRTPTPTSSEEQVAIEEEDQNKVIKEREYPEIQTLERISPTPRLEVKGISTSSFDPISVSFIGSGILILGSCGILIFLKKRRGIS